MTERYLRGRPRTAAAPKVGAVDLDGLLALVRDGRGRYDGGEIVDDLAHALQTAALALAAGAPDDLVAAALLHDVGHHPALAAVGGRHHEDVAADLVEPLLGPRAAFTVRHHVAAKRHLVATDPGYPLSPSSAASLARQGGPAVVPELVGGWGPLALELRRWDDLAKVPGAPEPDWDEVAGVVRRASAQHERR